MNAQQPFTAGTRLKVRTLTSDDGAKQQIGFFDSEVGVACTFGLASDGTQRCMPITQATLTTNFFGDISCTTRVAISGCADVPAFARESVGTCGAADFYQVTGAHSGGVYVLNGPTCSAVAAPPVGAFDIGPAIPASTWMKAVESVE